MTIFQSQMAQFQTALLNQKTPETRFLSARGATQFEVYRNAYRARLRSALRDNFETLPEVMGDDAFDALAEAYIAAEPSTHYSLRWFGHRLVEFMASNDGLVAHPAMTDLACMEWALRAAFDAEQVPELTATDLAALPANAWPELHLVLHPSVRLLQLQWAVGPVWHALKTGQVDVPAPEALHHPMLVWRNGLQPQWKSLTDAEAKFVHGLQASLSFGQICEDLCQTVGEAHAAPTAAAVLRQLVETGAIAGP